MATKSIPDGYHSVTPYLITKGAADAIDFYKRAFGATELMRMASPDGKIGHAEIRIGDSAIMLADEHPGHRSPQSLGGAGVSLMVYVDRVDEVFQTSGRSRSERAATRQRPVLRRSIGDVARSVRTHMDCRNAHGGYSARRDAPPRREIHAGSKRITRCTDRRLTIDRFESLVR